MKEVFRVTKKYWVMEEGFILLVMPIVGAFLYYLGEHKTSLIGFLLPMLFLPSSYKLWRMRLEIDDTGLSIPDARDPLTIRWSDVQFAKLTHSFNKPRNALSLITKLNKTEKYYELSLDYYDGEKIWKLAQQFLPAHALTDEGRKQTEAYKSWEAERNALLNNVTGTLKAGDSLWQKSLSWLFFLLCSFATITFLIPPVSIFGFILSLPFTAYALFLAINAGTTEVNHESVKRKMLRGEYCVRWDEVTRIEQDQDGSLILYVGNNYLAIHVFRALGVSKSIGDIAEFISAKIDSKQIPVTEVRQIRANFKFAKGTKV